MLSTWRLSDVVVAVELAGGIDEAGWRRFEAEVRRAVEDAEDLPFQRVLLVTSEVDFVERWKAAQISASALPLAFVSDGPGADEIALIAQGRGFNARAFTMVEALAALEWLAIDGVRARAILREVSGADFDTSALRPVLSALEVRAATPGTLAVDAERFRIARDLHDGVCASLAGLRMRLGVLSTMSADDDMQSELDALASRLEGVLDDVRSIAWAMRVGEPTWQQLSAYLVRRIQELTGSRVETALELRGVHNRVPQDAALSLVKAAQAGAARVAQSAGGVVLHLNVTEEQAVLGLEAEGDGATWWSTVDLPV